MPPAAEAPRVIVLPTSGPDADPGSFARALNHAAASSGRADLAIASEAAMLPGGWLERLAPAAHSDEALAGATATAVDSGAPTLLTDPLHPPVPTLLPGLSFHPPPAP